MCPSYGTLLVPSVFDLTTEIFGSLWFWSCVTLLSPLRILSKKECRESFLFGTTVELKLKDRRSSHSLIKRQRIRWVKHHGTMPPGSFDYVVLSSIWNSKMNVPGHNTDFSGDEGSGPVYFDFFLIRYLNKVYYKSKSLQTLCQNG